MFALYWNFSLFSAINQPAGQHPAIDAVMIFAANDLIVALPLLLLSLWIAPWLVAGDSRALRLETRRILLLAVIAAALALGINLALGAIIFEPRPFIAHHVHDLIPHPPDSSFPSDHTAISFAIAVMLWHLPNAGRSVISGRWIAPQLLGLLAIACATFIGVARIYCGLHYPGDVLAGALIGIISAQMLIWLRPLLNQPMTRALRLAHRVHLA